MHEALAQPGASNNIPAPESLGFMIAAEMSKVSAAELRTIVPIIQKCLELYAHLNDESNTGEGFRAIAGALIDALSADPPVIHAVIVSARNRPAKDYADSAIIKRIGLARIANNDEALEFVRAGFQDPSSRFSSVQAVSHLPKAVRDRLAPELARVAEDPDEEQQLRSAARSALTEP